MKNIEFIKDLSWEDVFAIWRENEEAKAVWEGHWRGRGFDSWEEWRERYVVPLRLKERKWKLYHVVDSGRTVAGWRGGPFSSWVEKYYDGGRAATFGELMRKPELREHEGIRRMVDGFDGDSTTVTGVLTDDGIVVVEGMHRCCAVVLAEEEGRPMGVEFRLALGSHLSDDLPVVGRFTAESGFVHK